MAPRDYKFVNINGRTWQSRETLNVFRLRIEPSRDWIRRCWVGVPSPARVCSVGLLFLSGQWELWRRKNILEPFSGVEKA